jgi:hypothetical protein
MPISKRRELWDPVPRVAEQHEVPREESQVAAALVDRVLVQDGEGLVKE